ncbi:MAG: pentapeptide repeat-containing protein [Goleter apudmare HA4340-LM2]|jgi:hypothetical protein|nr:pentapeptide repeat-containing protein [Goleter apudmare HA4340-LM2]
MRIFDIPKKIKFAQKKSSKKPLIAAIQKLHHNHIETHLAAIDDLEKILQDEPKFYWEIMAALTNFVRDYTSQNESKSQPLPTIRTDIQAALIVIGRRDAKKDSENEQLDLSHANIAGANLCGSDLKRANLYQVNLSGANLCGANLYGAILSAANLKGANLSDANLEQAILCAANLEGANLSGANLDRANLYLAKLN